MEAVITITGNKFELTSLTRERTQGDTFYIIGSAPVQNQQQAEPEP